MEPIALVAGGAIGAAVCGRLWTEVKRCAFAGVADRDTGEQRRKAAPPHIDITGQFMPGCIEFELAKEKNLDNPRAFVTLRNGQNIFYQTFEPPKDDKVQGVIILFHGFGEHCDLFPAVKARALCSLGPFAAATFDFPGHGRSDGEIAHIQDWLEFVDAAAEVVKEHLLPLIRKKWGNVKVFGMGESLGGGVLFSLLIRERQLLDGAIMICPMLFVSRDLLPAYPIMQVFKHVLAPIFPMWPIAPNKDIKDFCWRDKDMIDYLLDKCPYHKDIVFKSKPRLRTAFALAFEAGDWMKPQIQNFDVPALIIHGGADQVTDARVSKELFDGMKHSDKEFQFPEDVWHAELFHGGPTMREATKERLEAMAKWLRDRC